MPIRGFFAPASLKPTPIGTAAVRAVPYPGLLCPGLIEANVAPSGPSAKPPYPGLLCPGLIEASDGELCHGNHGIPIRGFFAPASLKLPAAAAGGQ